MEFFARAWPEALLEKVIDNGEERFELETEEAFKALEFIAAVRLWSEAVTSTDAELFIPIIVTDDLEVEFDEALILSSS